jgi:hypothetical protein
VGLRTVVVRRIVVAVCVGGVAGLIVTSILDRTGAAVTIGLVTAAAVVCLIVATAVAPPPTAATPPAAPPPPGVDEAQAARVEQLVGELVAGGADEGAVRDLVRESLRLGRGGGRAT